MKSRGPSSGSIKDTPASVRQPLGFRTMYSSMHGEQIELSQAYAGALAGRSTHTSHAAALPQAVPSTAGGLSQVQPKCANHLYSVPYSILCKLKITNDQTA